MELSNFYLGSVTTPKFVLETFHTVKEPYLQYIVL